MIEYKIISRRTVSPGTSPPTKREKIAIIKSAIYNRVVKKWKHRFKVGDEVTVVGTKMKGRIKELMSEEDTPWDGLNPLWILIESDERTFFTSVRQIRK